MTLTEARVKIIQLEGMIARLIDDENTVVGENFATGAFMLELTDDEQKLLVEIAEKWNR